VVLLPLIVIIENKGNDNTFGKDGEHYGTIKMSKQIMETIDNYWDDE